MDVHSKLQSVLLYDNSGFRKNVFTKHSLTYEFFKQQSIEKGENISFEKINHFIWAIFSGLIFLDMTKFQNNP